MTPEDLRMAMPVTREVAYLNTGASGPSPSHVVDAVADFQAYHEFEAPAEEGMYPAGMEAIESVRDTVARFLSASPSDITFTESTGDAINRIASAIDWQPGDVVVRTDLEHPAGILPWQRLEDTHDIDVRVVETERGRFDLEAFADAVTDARLVCLSSLSWNFGTQLPIETVTDLAHESGALVLVDAVQSIGQVPINVTDWGADFVAGSAHKWPLGPWGSGILYLDKDARRHLRPTRIGGLGVVDPQAESYAYKDSASMLEVSTSSAAIKRGLGAALETIESIGFDTIQARIERLTDRLKEGIPPDRLLSPSTYESGLVSFNVDDTERFVERLRDDGIVIRSLPSPDCVRASVHVFNTTDEIDALLDHV